MSKMYKRLLGTARFLEKQIGTEWAMANEDKYDIFATKIEKAYERGSIDAREFNSLAMIAFYDYPEGFKGDPEDESVLDFTGLEEPDPKYHMGCGRKTETRKPVPVSFC